jgi:hypothetical protein
MTQSRLGKPSRLPAPAHSVPVVLPGPGRDPAKSASRLGPFGALLARVAEVASVHCSLFSVFGLPASL